MHPEWQLNEDKDQVSISSLEEPNIQNSLAGQLPDRKVDE